MAAPSLCQVSEVIAQWKGMLPINGDIVVVEENDLLRQLMADILAGIRARVIVFEKADDALMHVLDSHGHCSLLIVDHSGPKQIPGLDLAKIFRAKWPMTPVILTSGYELDLSDLPACVIYLQKPWPVGKLIETIAQSFTARHTRNRVPGHP